MAASAEPQDPEPRALGGPDLQPGGLYDGFEAYRTPTDADYRDILSNGLIVPDTNVLLNLYRYNEQTRGDLFAVMNGLKERLWVPHQVMQEFWRSREAILQDPRSTVSTVRELTAQSNKAVDTFRSWANRVSLAEEQTERMTAHLTRAFGAVIEGVKKLADDMAAEFARDTNKDPVLGELERILRNRVGPTLNDEAYQEALAEARSRSEAKKPPGYKDSGKDPVSAAGDYLVWVQVLKEAKARRQNVLLVTGDTKEDWWRREHGELRGPRPELVEEMRGVADVRLFMTRPDSLLLQARTILQIRVRDESVQDVERVDRDWETWNTELDPNIPDLGVMDGAWADILSAVKGRSRVAWLLLSNASLVGMDGNTLVIEFMRIADGKAFMKHDHALLEVLHEKFGADFEIGVIYPKS
jgi:hypothetical protein